MELSVANKICRRVLDSGFEKRRASLPLRPDLLIFAKVHHFGCRNAKV